MPAPFWKALGIAPTPDEADIRRAYAARLRVTNPEDDAEGFKALREAYEHAMGYARYTRMHPGDTEAYEDDDEADNIDEEHAEEEGAFAVQPLVVTRASAPGAGQAPHEPLTRELPPQDPFEIERRGHDVLCQRLATALQEQRPPQEALEALDAILKSPAMMQMDVFSATEGWLIHMLVSLRPASGPLFEPAIAFFKWEDDRVGSRNTGAQHVLYLRERVLAEEQASRLLARVKDKRHEYHAAWKETLRPPSERSRLNKVLTLFRTRRVNEFIDFVRGRAPVMLESLNREALEWWRGRIATAQRVGRIMSWVGPLAFLIAVVALAPIWSGVLNRTQRPSYMITAVRPPPPRAVVEDRRGLLERLPADAPENLKRIAARRDCTDAAKRLGKVPPGVKTFATSEAEFRCNKILEMTPDSLLMRQYAGIVALRLEQPEAALEHFTAILKAAPDDAYALFGKGLVATIALGGAEIGNPKDMSDALAINPYVGDYFSTFNLLAPDIEPSPKKPRSRIPKPKSFKVTTQAEELPNADVMSGQAISDYLGLSGDISGTVVVECLINAKGRAGNCHVAKEDPENMGLGEIGLLSTQNVRYKPAMIDDEPVGGIPLTYTLRYGTTPRDTPEAD